MNTPLGRGLESLIPDKNPDNALAVSSSAGAPSIPSLPEVASSFEPASEASAPSLQARTYQDHFTPRRGESVFWIEIEKIEPNPFQPRREFNPEALQQLAGSIREHGVLQPVLVSKREKEMPTGLEVRYELIAGERRWRAAQMAGLSQIPAVVRRGIPDDRIKLELAIIENVQREDLNAMERARAFKQLIDEFHLVQREVASRIGKSREMIANTLRLLTLPPEIQQAIHGGQISEGHARAILMAGDETTRQFDVYHAILAERLNVRETESRARQVSGKMLTPRSRLSKIQDPQVREWQNKLQERLGTKVQLSRVGDRGKIVVEFYSEEELQGLMAKLIQTAEEKRTIEQAPETQKPETELPAQSFTV